MRLPQCHILCGAALGLVIPALTEWRSPSEDGGGVPGAAGPQLRVTKLGAEQRQPRGLLRIPPSNESPLGPQELLFGGVYQSISGLVWCCLPRPPGCNHSHHGGRGDSTSPRPG